MGLDNGKIEFTWGRTLDNKIIFLQVKSISPVELTYNIQFDPSKDYALLEIIVKTHMFYIQAGKKGDRLSHDLNKPKLFIELDISEFEKDILLATQKAKEAHFQQAGIPRSQIPAVINEFNKEWSNFIDKRFKSPS